jgi:hypothetical protein
MLTDKTQRDYMNGFLTENRRLMRMLTDKI